MPANKKLAIQLETVDALVAEFRKRWDLEGEDEKAIEDFKTSLKNGTIKTTATEKKKRAPSAYNLFVQSKKEQIIAAGFKGKDMIKEAARLWKEEHNTANGDASTA